MGLRGDSDLIDDGGGKVVVVSCSICLEAVIDNGDRSWSKLQCGHQFHLDCIGSAFNSKGAMQCPNCRKIEKGQWLYANGSRPMHEFSMDDWVHDEDLYDLNSYPELSVGVHWCPFSGLATRFPTSFDEGEFQSNAYHDLLGHHTMSATHPCPYVAYLGPIHPSSSASSGSASDASSFHNHWSGTSVPNEVPSSFAFPSMDGHFNGWDQSSIQPVTQRSARNNSDVSRNGMHPFIVGHRSSSRAPSSVTSSMVPPYPATVSRSRNNAPSLEAYFQQSNANPVPRRSNGHRGSTQAVPIASPSDQSSGFYFFSSNSSGRTFQEAGRERFHVWEREHQPSFPANQMDNRDSIWGPFHPPPAVGSDANGSRSNGSRQRHGLDRMPQNRS